MNIVWILAFVTFACVLAFAGWNLISVRRRQKYGRTAHGVGGSNDPMSGTQQLGRSPEAIRSSLDSAALNPTVGADQRR